MFSIVELVLHRLEVIFSDLGVCLAVKVLEILFCFAGCMV